MRKQSSDYLMIYFNLLVLPYSPHRHGRHSETLKLCLHTHGTQCLALLATYRPGAWRTRDCQSTVEVNPAPAWSISRPVKLQTKKEEEEKKQITVKLCISSAYAVSLRLSQNYCEALRRWRQQQILTGDTHSIKGPPQHLLLTPKAASAIYATPEHCGYLLMLNEHGATAPPPSCNCGTNHQHAAAKVRQKVLRFISCHLFSARFKIDS